MAVFSQRIHDVRILHKDTQEQLADSLGVTKQAVSKYESGKMIPAHTVLDRLMSLYGLSADFLSKCNPEEIRNQNMSEVYYRRKGRREAKLTEYLDVLMRYAYEILCISKKFLSVHTLSLPAFAEGDDIEETALRLREYWGLGRGPIRDLEAVLARFGIYTFVYDLENEKLDGCARRIGENGIILLNSTQGTRARQQFDLAHELGHILLHTVDEESANAFAGAFLLPKTQISRRVLRPDMDYLLKVKDEWGVSLSCVLERHRRLNLFSDDCEENFAKYEYLRRKIGSLGWKKHEPDDEDGRIGENLQIGNIIKEIWEDMERREAFLDELYIPAKFVKKLCGLPAHIFANYIAKADSMEIDGAQLSFTFI